MAEIGVDLAAYAANLSKVPDQHDLKPVCALDALATLGPRVEAYMQAFFKDTNVERVGHNLPARAFDHLTIDETAKIIASFDYGQPSSIFDEMIENPVLNILHKIRSSAWGWSYDKIGWNETVAAYEGIRAFDLCIPDFTVTLDHTAWRHKQGKSQHAGLFLDGVFGYLVHYRGKHVMTIGFSIASGRRLLLQQVQVCQATGNRWLYKMPANRMELIIERLQDAFPAHTLFVVDGASAIQNSMTICRNAQESTQRTLDDYRARLDRLPDNEDLPGYIADEEQRLDALDKKMAELETEKPRLDRFYGNLGRYQRANDVYDINHLRHHAIAA